MRFVTLILLTASAVTVSACSESSEAPDGGTDASSDAATDGSDDGGSCPSGQSYFEPGCGEDYEIVITPGCYEPCDTELAFGECTDPSLYCQRTTTNPCICTPEDEVCCGACGAETLLCLPWDTSRFDPYEMETLDEECEGLTGQQLLDVAGGSHTVPFTYVDGTTADTELTLTFTYADGTITCQPTINQPPGVGAPDLPAHVELEVEASVSSADGAFDETTTAVLQLDVGGSVMHNFDFDAGSLTGSYTPSDPDLVDRVRFGGTISEMGLRGTAYEDGHSPGGAMSVAPIGNWDTVP
jgi:hypothetical protein